MAMTKKHYEMVAKVMRLRWEDIDASCIDFPSTSEAILRYRENRATVTLLSDYFASDNPQFDRARFLKACGVSE